MSKVNGWNLSRCLRRYFYYSRMAYKLDWQLPRHTAIRFGMYDFENYTYYSKNDISIRVGADWFLGFDVFKIKISLHTDNYETIELYDDGWEHNTPKEMKSYIYSVVEGLIDQMNKWEQEGIFKAFDKLEKDIKKQKKEREKLKYEKEQEYLMKRFKK